MRLFLAKVNSLSRIHLQVIKLPVLGTVRFRNIYRFILSLSDSLSPKELPAHDHVVRKDTCLYSPQVGDPGLAAHWHDWTVLVNCSRMLNGCKLQECWRDVHYRCETVIDGGPARGQWWIVQDEWHANTALGCKRFIKTSRSSCGRCPVRPVLDIGVLLSHIPQGIVVVLCNMFVDVTLDNRDSLK